MVLTLASALALGATARPDAPRFACIAVPAGLSVRHRHLGRTTGPLRLNGARSDYPSKSSTDRTGRFASLSTCIELKGKPMETGTVKGFNETKGFGFIQPDNGGKDVFVHVSAVQRSGLMGLREGQKVSYELQTDQRNGKTSAVNLQAA